jgi:hypothetical protein
MQERPLKWLVSSSATSNTVLGWGGKCSNPDNAASGFLAIQLYSKYTATDMSSLQQGCSMLLRAGMLYCVDNRQLLTA